MKKRTQYLISVGIILAMYLIGSIAIQGFFGFTSIRSILVLGAFLGLASVGQTLVVVLAGIDLSIPFVMDFGNVASAQLLGYGLPFWEVTLVIVIVAFLIGSLNGYISSRLKVHPLIVTLGIGYAVQGLVLAWTKGMPSGSTPAFLSSFVSTGTSTGPIPLPPIVIVWIVVMLAILFLQGRTVYGRRLYALGSNPEAARLALVSPTRMWMCTYGVSSVFAALAGLLLLGFSGSAFGDVGAPYLFETVATVVIGGTVLLGGQGGYLGTVFGTLIITEIAMVMVGFNISNSLEQVTLGVLIVILVAIYGRERHVRERI